MSQGRGSGLLSLSSSVFLSLSHVVLQSIFVSNHKNMTEWNFFWYAWSSYKAVCFVTVGRTMCSRVENSVLALRQFLDV